MGILPLESFPPPEMKMFIQNVHDSKGLNKQWSLNHPTKTPLLSGQGSRVASGKTRIFQSTSAGFDMFESQSHLSTFLSAASLLDLTVSNWLIFQINLVISKNQTRNRKRYHCCWSHVGLLSRKLLHSAFSRRTGSVHHGSENAHHRTIRFLKEGLGVFEHYH